MPKAMPGACPTQCGLDMRPQCATRAVRYAQTDRRTDRQLLTPRNRKIHSVTRAGGGYDDFEGLVGIAALAGGPR